MKSMIPQYDSLESSVKTTIWFKADVRVLSNSGGMRA